MYQQKLVHQKQDERGYDVIWAFIDHPINSSNLLREARSWLLNSLIEFEEASPHFA